MSNMENTSESNTRRNSFITFICTAIIASSLTYAGVRSYYFKSFKEFRLLAEAEEIVDKHFYYSVEDRDKLTDSAVGGYIGALDDRYSRYQSVKETVERNDTHAGLKVGIGITVMPLEDGFIKIVEVSANSPSEKAGIKAGDIILKIDGNDVKETGYNESVDYIRNGEENSVVKITVKRDGEIKDIDVKREKIEVITASGEMTEPDIGYIAISQFNDKTPEQLRKTYEELAASGAKGIVFDLRNNGGGLVTSVQGCLDPLLPEGDIAVAVYRDGKEEVIVTSDSESSDIPAVVLINGKSASGAELFAASMRDFRSCELIGETSFGKGIMQDTFSLSNGSTVVLTVAEYRTTRSECYHGKGIVPDYEVADDDAERDLQYEKAVEVLKKKFN